MVCPRCENELYVHLFFSDFYMLKCLTCDLFYKNKKNESRIEPYEMPADLKEQLEKDETYKDYTGTPVSRDFESGWKTWVRKIIKRR
ncbi:hypothetical protein PA598K_00709 [Paenibacillus sp. 598K]|nr:hypothetical protein PA598K_00709 [Paenibacillus sp. 598K]